MKLRTLGGLSVEGVAYKREKPLLLLAYLCLEGQKTRKHLAELFWPDAANPMNSLAQTLIRLRQVGQVVCEDGPNVQATCECDALEFRAHLRAGRLSEALTLYGGAFLAPVRLRENLELEEWLSDTQAALGAEARSAYLSQAEYHRNRRETPEAAQCAELAYAAPGATFCEPEDLLRIYHLLGRGHPLAISLKREAQELGLHLPTAPEAPPAPTLIGRKAELAALAELPAGQIAWVSGPPGIGKSTLLAALAAGGGWRILPGRSGLPLATLEPLAPHGLSNTAEALHLLRDAHLKIAIDGWEDTDDTTQTVLNLAARQRPGATILITARGESALPADEQLTLGPLTQADLQDHPGALAATAGHPSLLAAYLRGTPPERTLEAHLNFLGDDHKRLFLALAAQDTPHLNATRSALKLNAAAFAQTLDHLTREGLTTPDGLIRPTTPARDLLAARPLDTQLLHLQLARCHPHTSAWPHFLQAIHLWEEVDQEAAAKAAHYYADQEMKRGYPARATKTLEVAPQTDEVKLLRGWALLECGGVPEALQLIQTLPENPDVLAAKALALARSSRPEDAAYAANQIPKNGTPAHANAEFILGFVAQQHENHQRARSHFQVSVTLWNILGNEREWIKIASVLAACQSTLGTPTQEAFKEVLEAVNQFPQYKGMIYGNYAHALCQAKRLPEALRAAHISYESGRELGDNTVSANALNTMAVVAQFQGNDAEAIHLYQEALACTHATGNLRMIGVIASNLAELQGDLSSLIDTLVMLENAGQHELAERLRIIGNPPLINPQGERSRPGHEA